MKVISVVGARPNFMKVAPLHSALTASAMFESIIVHTGQHYDERMSDIFFRQLGMPEPDRYLGVGSGSHAQQTAKVMTLFEQVLIEESPDLVIVVGDVNSTVACALVATKMHVPVAHVEAGLRSGDRSMPEEINRIVTDSISDHLFVTEEDGLVNLNAEGVSSDRVHFVGNVMIDSLVKTQSKAADIRVEELFGVEPGEYVLMTMHRPSNVDNAERLGQIVATVYKLISSGTQVVFPMHPRTESNLKKFGLLDDLKRAEPIISEPIGYVEFLAAMRDALAVVTDSGGIQEETTYLQVPCLTIRENTERPSTITVGSNQLLELDPDLIYNEVRKVKDGAGKNGAVPPLWDGKSAERIVEVLENVCAHKDPETNSDFLLRHG